VCRADACCDLHTKWEKLTTRPISPTLSAELDSVWRMLAVVASYAMQVISLEGSLDALLSSLILRSVFRLILQRASSDALGRLSLCSPLDSMNTLHACSLQNPSHSHKQNVSHLKTRSCNVAERKRHSRKPLRRRAEVCVCSVPDVI
jgi:hypothetical protein